MTPEYWQRIKKIFENAVDKNPAERSQYLDNECSGDNKLRSEIDSLLTAYKSTNNFLESSFEFDPDSYRDAEKDDPLIGKEFRSYRIDRLIASGGMASVYLASRADEQFKKQTAIKFIKRGMDTDEIIGRFKNERNALANLDHPNIAKIIDGGTTDSGLPYFIMEFIEGVPIDQYCSKKKLSIKKRLKIFRTVCSAVHYAHQNLIIHRDIKPSNILVTSDEIPKLLDFGIAKILGSDGSPGETKFTQFGSRIMTLEYASPEQVKGEKITTASDIYSLGVLLYELLTGHRPYKLKNQLPFEAEKIITSTEPVKPSTAVKQLQDSKEGLNDLDFINSKDWNEENKERMIKQLSGDLDNIILMALKKKPERRYSSVQEFSEDIQRYFNALPVTAHKDSLKYRASKFIRRHKTGAAASFIILLLFILGFILISRQADIAAEERDRARFEARKSEQINEFLNEMLSAADPSKLGKDITVAEVLKKASDKIQLELINLPEIEADVRTTIGVTYQNLGMYDEAEHHLYKALKLRDSLYGENNIGTAKSLKNYGLILHYQGKFDEAKWFYEKSIEVHKKLYEKPTASFAEALNDYGTLLNDLEQYDSAESVMREALKIYYIVHEKDHADIGSTLNNLALILHFKGDLEEAEKLYRESLRINFKLFGEDYPQISYNLNNLAFVMHDKKDYASAESLFTKAYNLRSKLLGKDHPEVGIILFNLGAEYYYLKNYTKSEQYIQEAINMWHVKLEEDHHYFGRGYYWLGKVKNEIKQPFEAEAHLRKALEVRKKIYDENNPALIITKCELGKSLILQKRYKEAEIILIQNYKKLEADKTGNESDLNYARNLIIDLYNNWGKKEEVERWKF